jgi:hypothetical protein
VVVSAGPQADGVGGAVVTWPHADIVGAFAAVRDGLVEWGRQFEVVIAQVFQRPAPGCDQCVRKARRLGRPVYCVSAHREISPDDRRP